MKTALITSTIHVPEVLRLYRACSYETKFFVAIDKKTPEKAVNFCQYDVTNTQVCFLQEQEQEQYACSSLLGWNTVERRNIATLEALKWGAEIIVTVDDDNIPMSTDYFDRYEMVLGAPFSGIQAVASWFDPGQLLVPPSRHRGFPVELTNVVGKAQSVVDAKIGVAAGIVLGDPDISAVDRLAQGRYVHHVSELLRAGIVIKSGTKTVFNSQNTAFLRELAPCFLMCPQFGRYSDIFASLIAQRVMRETGHVVHFGQPFVWQQRNPHNLIDDLKAEMWGMEHVLQFAEWLDGLYLSEPVQAKYGNVPAPVIEQVQRIYDRIQDLEWMPAGVSELGAAWCDDIEKVMG